MFFQEHFFHILFSLLPLLIGGGILLKDNTRLSRYKAFVLIILLFFASIHLNPLQLLMMYHHQGHSSYQHPCCMPQAATPITEFILKSTSTIVEALIVKPVLPAPHIVILSIHNRSPPSSS